MRIGDRGRNAAESIFDGVRVYRRQAREGGVFDQCSST